MEFLKTTIHKEEEEKTGKGKKSKIISQGTYGCTYYPGFTCTGKLIKNKYLTKLQYKNEVLENELAIGKRIQQIKNYTNYFAPILEECPIDYSSLIQKNKQLNECKIIHEHEKNDEKFSLNKIKYILGNDLDKVIEENRINHPSTSLKLIIDTYLYLLKSLKKLENKDILHYDLKANNIMYEKESEIPVIIDFGLSIPLEKFNPENPEPQLVKYYFFDTYKYDYWCLDVIFLGIYGSFFNTYLEETDITSNLEAVKKYNQETVKDTLLETFNLTLKKYMDYVFFFSSSFLNKCKQLFPPKHPIQNRIKTLPQVFYQKWQKYLEDNQSLQLKDLFKDLWNARQTWDRYSLSVIYINFICETHPIPLEEKYRMETFVSFTDTLFDTLLALPNERENIQYPPKTPKSQIQLPKT
jgi:serine/threonine protein kinase